MREALHEKVTEFQQLMAIVKKLEADKAEQEGERLSARREGGGRECSV